MVGLTPSDDVKVVARVDERELFLDHVDLLCSNEAPQIAVRRHTPRGGPDRPAQAADRLVAPCRHRGLPEFGLLAIPHGAPRV